MDNTYDYGRILKTCIFPNASKVGFHGLQTLPQVLPIAELDIIDTSDVVMASSLSDEQLSQMARVVAYSFAQREPMTRHLLNMSGFTKTDLLYAFIVHYILDNPEAVSQSLAILQNGHVIGGAFNETLSLASPGEPAEMPYVLEEAMRFLLPIMQLLTLQEEEGCKALCEHYPDFKLALASKKVGHHFMVARSDQMSSERTFGLVVATMKRYRELKFPYVVIEATNNWTGAACEALNCIRVHFAPYRVARSYSSPDGYLSDKDSGSMFYVCRIS